MKKRAVIVVFALCLALAAPFASGKAFVWTLDALDEASFKAPSVPANFTNLSIPLNKAMSIDQAWAYGWKNRNRCGTSFVTEFWLDNKLAAIGRLPEAEWQEPGCVPYGKGGMWRGPFIPEGGKVLAGTVSFRRCHDACYGNSGGGISEVRVGKKVASLIRAGAVTASDMDLDLGSISSLTGGEEATTTIIATKTQGVIVWLGSIDDKGQTQISGTSGHAWACIDTDLNNQCDGDQATDCIASGGDWYKGVCCGKDVVCSHNTGLNAYCGKVSEDQWEWAPADDTGGVHALLDCPGTQMLANGSALYSCGKEIAGTLLFTGFVTAHNGPVSHDFVCEGSTITECAGRHGGFSKQSAVSTGTTLPAQEGTFYCASDGNFTTDLDSKDEESCAAAGYDWTGTKCCSEEDDPGEYYNEQDSSVALGGCWNRAFIEKGYFAVADRILNYNGSFHGCRLQEDEWRQLQDTHTGTWLIDNSIEACGMVLADAQPGGRPHAVCRPDGKWEFTDEPGGTINKSIAWTGIVSLARLSATGCCAADQCWNGTRCMAEGTFHRIGDSGFVCRQLPAAGQGADWQPVGVQYSWDLAMGHTCANETQCLLHVQGNPGFDGDTERWFRMSDPKQWPKCINDTQSILDYRCEKGNWTTRTKHIALSLLGIAGTASPDDFTLFCDTFDRTLNQYRYAVQGAPAETYLGQFCSKSGKIVPCINSMCVLRTPGKVALGTTLNAKIDDSLKSFLKALNKNPSLCAGAQKGQGFTQCGEGIWFSHELQAVLLLPPGMSPGQEPADFPDTIREQLQDISSYAITSLHKPEKQGMNFAYFTKARLFNHIYAAQKGTRRVFSFLDTGMRPESDPVPMDYLGVKYSGISLGPEPCLMLIKPYDSRAFCENQTTQGFTAIARHRPGLGESPLAAAWPALTGKLRP